MKKEYEPIERSEVLFEEDLEKIEHYVAKYPLGSYQIGEIAKLSGLLFDKGVDVVRILQKAYGRYK